MSWDLELIFEGSKITVSTAEHDDAVVVHKHVDRVKSEKVLGATKALHGLACDVQNSHVGALVRKPLEATDHRVALEHFCLSTNE